MGPRVAAGRLPVSPPLRFCSWWRGRWPRSRRRTMAGGADLPGNVTPARAMAAGRERRGGGGRSDHQSHAPSGDDEGSRPQTGDSGHHKRQSRRGGGGGGNHGGDGGGGKKGGGKPGKGDRPPQARQAPGGREPQASGAAQPGDGRLARCGRPAGDPACRGPPLRWSPRPSRHPVRRPRPRCPRPRPTLCPGLRPDNLPGPLSDATPEDGSPAGVPPLTQQPPGTIPAGTHSEPRA